MLLNVFDVLSLARNMPHRQRKQDTVFLYPFNTRQKRAVLENLWFFLLLPVTASLWAHVAFWSLDLLGKSLASLF